METRRLPDHLPPVPEGCQTEGRWGDACDMRIGNEVLLADGRIVPIQGISYSPFEGDVYNFQVEDLHSYSVGQSRILVQNTYDESSLAALIKYIKQIAEEALETSALKSLSKRSPLIRPKSKEGHHIFTNFRKKMV